MKKYLYLIKNAKIPTYIKYWLKYSSKKVQSTLQSLPLMLKNTIKDTIIKITKIYGNTEQEVTENSPSPDFPSPVNNITGDVEVKVQNKNLFDETEYNDSSLYHNYNIYFAFVELPDKFKTHFYGKMFLKGTNQALVCGFSDSNTSVPNRMLGGSGLVDYIEYDFTNAENVYLIIGNPNRINISSDIPLIFNNYNIQVTKEISTTYTPHQEQNYPISLGSLELCKIGEYQDYIYKENGNWYKYGAIGKLILDNNSGLTYSNHTFKVPSTLTSNIVRPSSNYNKVNVLSNYLKPITWQEDWTSDKIGFIVMERAGNDTRIRVYYDDTLEQVNTWLQTHNIEIYYPCITPTITPITDTTLINQLEAIQNIKAYEDITNISSDKEIKIDIDYIQRG